ncbi:MAG: hypothetical protein RL213_374 [Bacteroidota bacterium]|jgi:PAS domain S-box-containing protein
MLSNFQDRQRIRLLHDLRILSVLTAVVVTGLGFVFEELYHDGWILVTGLIMSMSMTVLFLFSYYSPNIRKHYSRISDVSVFLLHMWAAFVCSQRDFEPVVLLPVAISVVTFSLIFDRFRESLVFIFTVTTLLALLMAIKRIWAPENIITLVSLYTGASISYLLQKRKERYHEEIATQESRFAALVENMNDGLIYATDHWRIGMVSDQFCRISGYSRKELLGSDLRKLIPAGDNAGAANSFFRSLSEGRTEREDFQLLHKGEGRIDVRANGAPYRPDGPERGGFMIVFTDLTSLKQTGRELREAYAELDTFFYKASHDLRGPLASMMGVVAIGKSESADPDIRRYFGMVETSVQRLDSTLLELIELARTRKGVSKLNSVAIDVVLDRVDGSLRSLPRYGKVRFIRNVPEKRMIYTDPLLLQSVLQNLVHNAVNYSDREHPEVRIDVEEHADEYEVRIADNGAGIPVQVRPRIFEMFYRGHLDSSGPGLGLFIVRNALEKMGGSIRFECPPGRGTVFYITLPKYLP